MWSVAEAGRTTIHVSGDADVRSRAPLLQAVIDAVNGPNDAVLIDLGAVNYLGSAGLATLVTARRYTERRGSTFALRVSTDVAARPLRATGLWFRFTIVEAPGSG